MSLRVAKASAWDDPNLCDLVQQGQ